MLSRYHRIPERNGQTDGRTDGQKELLYQYRASVKVYSFFLRRNVGLICRLWSGKIKRFFTIMYENIAI